MALAISGLAVFTVWISWRAKALETRLHSGSEITQLLRKPAPDFTLQSLDGRAVSLGDFRGKKNVVVSFWASWCGPCRMEIPSLRAFYQQNHKADADFEFVAVSIDDDRSAAEQYAATAKMPFPVLLDAAKKASDAYGVESIPQLFVIDKNGTVTYGVTGYMPGMEFALANALGIKDYSPVGTKPNFAAGAPDGNTGH